MSSETATAPAAPAPPPVPGRATRPVPLLRARAALPAAAGGGLLTYLAFPGHDLWFLAPLGIAALVLAVAGRRARAAALVGWVFGLGLMLPLLSWTGVYLGLIAWVPLSVLESLFSVAAALLITAVLALPAPSARRAGSSARAQAPTAGRAAAVGHAVLRAVGVAGVWTATEAVAARYPFGGFGWGRLAFSQADAPTLGLAAVGGAPLVSFAVALVGALLALAVSPALARRGAAPEPSTDEPSASGAVVASGRGTGRGAGRRAPRVAALVAAVVVLLAGALVPRPVEAQDGDLDVAAVQGNVPRAGLDFNAQRRAVLDRHVTGTEALVAAVAAGETTSPDLVVWPENSSDIDPFTNPDAAAEVDGIVDRLGVPLLFGTLVHNADGLIDNTSLLWEPGAGAVDSYVKQHPVPFGEYMPYRSFFRLFTDKVDLVGTDFAAGTETGVMSIPRGEGDDARLGVLICFEVVEDGLVADAVDAGAEVLTVQTNNATFGYTDESVQQLAMSRLRAVETGRAIVHISTVGVSSMVLPDGTATQRTDLYTPATIRADLPLRTDDTIATALRRAGVPVEGLLVGAGLAAALAGVVGGALARRTARA